MPKRQHESKEERWIRKMKEYEEKLQEKRSRRNLRVLCSSADDDVQLEERLQPDPPMPTDFHPALTEPDIPTETAIFKPDDQNFEPAAADILTDSFDTELLQLLGEPEEEPIEFGEDIEQNLDKRFNSILVNGLKKETREELYKKYLFPKNMPLSRAPTLNPEINFMSEICRVRDKRLLSKQDQLGKSLSALGKAMTVLLRKEKPVISEVLKTLNDAGKLIADSHFAETETRRTVIMPLVDKSLAESFKDRKRDGFLFGEKLDDAVRNSRGINKTGQMIQAPTTSTSSLNSRGPYPRTRQPRGGQAYPHRGNGQQRATWYRRRADQPSRQLPRHPIPPPQQLPLPPQSARRQPPASSQRALMDRPPRN